MTAAPDPGPPPDLAWLPVDRLDVDPAYQRTLDTPAGQKLIAKIAAEFDWMKFGAILTVPGEADEGGPRWKILDGQHRAAGARARGGIPHLPAVVHREASLAEQAAAFVGANRDRLAVSAQALFHARLVAGDPDCVTIARLCREAGIEVLRYPLAAAKVPAGKTAAVPVLLRCLKRHGEAATATAIAAVAECLGRFHGALRADVFAAAAQFMAGGNGEAALRLALARLGPAGLEEAGRGLNMSSAVAAKVARLRQAINIPQPRPAPAEPSKPGGAARTAATSRPAPVVRHNSSAAPTPKPVLSPKRSEQAEIERFLAERGATKLPGVGDAALAGAGELVWDKQLRKWTRPAKAS